MLTEQQGLQPAEFISISRDTDGFLWLLSPTRIQRYDGQVTRVFPVPPHPQEVFVDRDGSVWIISRHEIQQFVNALTGFRRVASAPDTTRMICLFYAQDKLLLMRSDGMFQYDQLTASFQPVTQLVKRNVQQVYAVNESHLFLASADSIFSLDLKSFQWLATPFRRTAGLNALSGNQVLASNTQLRSFLVRPGETEIREIKSDRILTHEPSDFLRVYSMVAISDSQYHLASSRGILQYDAGKDIFTEPVFYQRGERVTNTISVRTLCRDRDGTIYLTFADGIAYYNPASTGIRYLRSYTWGEDRLPDMDIRSFAEDQRGYIWMATLNGLAQLHPKTGEMKTWLAGDENSIDYPSVRHLLYHDGKLWVGTSGR